MPKVVFSGIDTKPADSLAFIFKDIGWEVAMLSDKGMDYYNSGGYSGGVRMSMLKEMGYSMPQIDFVDRIENADIFVDLKKKDLDSIKNMLPAKTRGMLYVINGGWDDYEDYGFHYPTITNNFWIKGNVFHCWSPPAYFDDLKPKEEPGRESPMGLLHNARNWGFGSILDQVREKTGLRVYGWHGSPSGMILNSKVPEYLEKASCFVHLKASDCPGWALYEAFATATPVVVTDLFIKRMKFQELYIDGETCLTWGKTSYKQDPEDEKKISEFIDANRENMIEEICECVEKLKNPVYNQLIGMNGHKKWKELAEWNEKKSLAFREFINSNFENF